MRAYWHPEVDRIWGSSFRDDILSTPGWLYQYFWEGILEVYDSIALVRHVLAFLEAYPLLAGVYSGLGG